MSSETIDLAEQAAAIKFWTRQALALPDDQIVSVSEFACGKPTCPNQHTAIMVMSQQGLERKISIHKRIAEIGEFDVLDACLELLRDAPA
jgi:hypothetical protein